MMDVVVADVGGEPSHDFAGLHVARRFESRAFIGPTSFIVKGDTREIMLGIKKVRAQAKSDEVRNSLSEEKTNPTNVINQSHGDGEVHNQRHEAIKMLFGFPNEWQQAHTLKKDEDITKSNGGGVTGEEIKEAC